METKSVQKPTSIFPNGEHEPIKKEYGKLSTGALLLFLFVCFFVLKSFIYVPDEKRKGK